MGVYLPNAKMPTGCFGCWVPKELCGLTINDTLNHRHADCPLVEITKHGRLADVDVLKSEILRTYEYEFPTASGAFDEFVTQIVPNIIKKAPAVIEAEEQHG